MCLVICDLVYYSEVYTLYFHICSLIYYYSLVYIF